MVNCPITREDIDTAECEFVCSEAKKEGKNNKSDVAKKYKRIVCWKGICKTCKYHK